MAKDWLIRRALDQIGHVTGEYNAPFGSKGAYQPAGAPLTRTFGVPHTAARPKSD